MSSRFGSVLATHAFRVALATCILPLLFTACRSGAAPADRLTVTDSGGVHILESSRSDGDDAWGVRDLPVFRIGWQTGSPRFEFIVSGMLRPDGSSVVGDLGSGTIYLISASGEILSTLHGEGHGPGEELDPSAIIGLGGDTILVHNATNLRVDTFVGDRLLGEIQFSNSFEGTYYTVFGRAGDGRFLLNPTGFDDSAFEGAVGWRDWPILRTGAYFSAVDTVASMPIIRIRPPGNQNPIRYWGEPVWTGHRLAYAATDRAEVRWLRLNGSSSLVVRWAAAPAEVDDALWSEYEARYRTRFVNVDTAVVAQRLAAARRDFAGPVPYFQSAYGDSRGDVWLEDYRVTLDPANSYLVVTPEGALHRVDFPGPIQILGIADALVLGVEENESGEQALVLYRLEKNR